MPFVFLLGFTGLTLSAVAIYYSVIGLTAIFAAAFWPIVIMGTTLEVSKLVAASWLKWNWDRIPRAIKSYMLASVFVLMFITSMGIFGFLSKAHIEQTSMSTEQVAQIGTLEEKITRSEAKIDRWQGEVDRLMRGEDVRVDGLIANEQEGLDKIYARIKDEKSSLQAAADKKIALQQERITQAQDRRDKAIATAEQKFKNSFGGGGAYEKAVKEAKDQELGVASAAQKEILAVNTQLDTDLKAVDAKYRTEIAAIQKRIQDLRNQANSKTQDIDARIAELEGFVEKEQVIIDEAREEKFAFEKTYRQLEAEVGPIKYIAEFIYGETDQNILERAVTWVIITIIFVFDPLAVLMLLAAQMTYAWTKGLNRENENDDTRHENNDPEETTETLDEGTEALRPAQEQESAEGRAEDDPVVATVEEIVDEEIPPTQEDETPEPEEQVVSEPDPEPIEEETQDIVESKKKDEQSVDDDEDEEEYIKNMHPAEKAAMHKWKAKTGGSLKIQRRRFRTGRIEELPWMKYLEPEADYSNEYVQNAEQKEDTLWNQIKKGKE